MSRYLIQAIGVFGFKLHLNNKLGRQQDQLVFGPFETIEEAKAFYYSELVEPYEDEGPDMVHHQGIITYINTFRKGGDLEWCEPFYSEEQWTKLDDQGAGVCEVLLEIIDLKKDREIELCKE